MSEAPKTQDSGSGDDRITILVVDDIPETRENVKKLLAFEPDFNVVGAAGTGQEGIALARELSPNIIIMDINMPDMDGIQATGQITETVPTAAVIMMSAHGDPDYLRRAMLAGARNFLTKPPDPEELYNTIRTVHERNKPLAQQYEQMRRTGPLPTPVKLEGPGNRAGNVVVVFSPQGGAGCTTIATNLASGLMKEDVRVLLVDVDLQFGDVGLFLNLQSQTNLTNVVASGRANPEDTESAFDIDLFDAELFENVVLTHDSGLKVLLGPARPEYAEEITLNASSVAQIIERVANNYDFIVIDTGHQIDDLLLSIFDLANQIVLVANPTLISLKNLRMVLDLFDNLEYSKDKISVVLNRARDERKQKQLTIIPQDRIEQFLRHSVKAQIPLVDERVVLQAIANGVAVVASRDRSKSPIKELIELSNIVHKSLQDDDDREYDDGDSEQPKKKGGGLRLRLGRT